MKNRFKPAILLSMLVAAALFVAACGDDDETTSSATTDEAMSAEMLMLNGEDTVLALDQGTARVLQQNEVAVAPIDPATAGDDGISFPITGGEVEAESLAGTIDHSGGLSFSAGNTEVELTDFVIDTSAGTLSASTADGAELVVLDVDLTGLERMDENGAIVLEGITTTLSDDAAAALNDAFSVKLFEGGLAIGDVTVTATAG